MVTRWPTSPTSVYCLVAVLAFARAINLSNQQPQQHQVFTAPASHNSSQAGAAAAYPSREAKPPRPSARDANHGPSPWTNHTTANGAPTSQQDAPRDESMAGVAANKRRLPHHQSEGGPQQKGDNRNVPSARQLSTRIETLDDTSHRLDQSTLRPRLELDDFRVPFWNIAHMINSIEQVDLALSAGSNGIETDVSFDASGRPVEAYHGFPCDCGRHCHHREDFVRFVRYLARVTVPPAQSRLFVVLFDLKLKDLRELHQKEAAGLMLAEILHKELYAEFERATGVRSRSALERDLSVRPPVRVIISINHAHDLPLARAFLNYLRKNRLDFMGHFVGWDVGMNDPLANITSAWDSLRGATGNIWQGDGLTNCANIVRGVERLKEAISVRNNQGHFRKVYYWTADVLYHIRSVLRLGIDAILTNQPQRAIQALQEPEFRGRYRLATPYDDPFMQFAIKPSAWGMSLPSLGEINETVTNIQRTGESFIKTLPDGVAAAFKKVQSSIG